MAPQVGDRRLDVAREALGKVGAFGVIQARSRYQAHMLAQIDGHAQRGREFRDGVGDAVIRGVGHDHAGAAGADLRNAIGEVVGLAARAGQHQVGQLGLRHAREQALCQLENRVVQIARIGGQCLHLPADRLGHRRVAMPERRDVVVGVEIAAPLRVDQPGAFAPHDVQRPLVHQAVGRAEQGVAARDHRGGGRAHVGAARDVGVDHVEVGRALH